MKRILIILVVVICFWTATINVLFQICNPTVTNTEAFMRLPKTLLLDWKK